MPTHCHLSAYNYKKNIRNPICFSPKDCLIAPFPSTYMIQREKFLDCPHNSSDSVVERIKSSMKNKPMLCMGKYG